MTTTALADMTLPELTQSLEDNIKMLQQVRNMRADTNYIISQKKQERDKLFKDATKFFERQYFNSEQISPIIKQDKYYDLEKGLDQEQQQYESIVNPLRRQIERMDIAEPQIRQVVEAHNREIARRNALL